MGALVGLVAHGGYGGLAVEIGVIVSLAVLVAAVLIQGRRETRREREGATPEEGE